MKPDGAPADPLPIAPLSAPIDATIRVPGSKSLSNRHLLLAAASAAPGRSIALRGVLRCDDTERLAAALERLGSAIDWRGDTLEVGCRAAAADANLGESIAVDLGDGGTPTRFMLAFAAAGCGALRGRDTWVTVDGSARMRERPVAEGIEMLRALGATVEYAEAPGRLPVRVRAGSLRGGHLAVGRTASSQFVSALLLVGAQLDEGIDIRFTEEPTSASYLELSLAVLSEVRGADACLVERAPDGHALRRLRVARAAPAPYRGASIEPDASSAVYPAAAAALAGGRVTLAGLPRASVQPDRHFLDDLARRGVRVAACTGPDGAPATLVESSGTVRAADADYALAPDAAVMAMVLAARADRPSLFTGLRTLRVKESDRIASVAAGLRALGGTVEVGEDWARVHPLPASATAAAIETVQDHRIAMAFAVLGLVRPGVSIRNPGCVAKSWPGFWEALDLLRGPATRDNRGSES